MACLPPTPETTACSGATRHPSPRAIRQGAPQFGNLGGSGNKTRIPGAPAQNLLEFLFPSRLPGRLGLGQLMPVAAAGARAGEADRLPATLKTAPFSSEAGSTSRVSLTAARHPWTISRRPTEAGATAATLPAHDMATSPREEVCPAARRTVKVSATTGWRGAAASSSIADAMA